MAFDPVFPEHVAVEVDLGSGYVELEDVQLDQPISISRGMPGTTFRDRVAQTGSMTFILDNSEDNSAELLGLYSLNHTNTLPGWRIGIPVRCRVTYLGVPEPVFVGTIDAIEPVSGKYGSRKVTVSCVDWMEEANRARVTGLTVQVNKYSHELFNLLVASVENPPLATLVSTGSDLYPYSFDNALSEEVSVYSEFQKLAISELALIFVSRDGTLTFQGRFERAGVFSLSETLTDEDLLGTEGGVDTTRGREEIVNQADVQMHPRRVDAAATSVLFLLGDHPRIERNTTHTFSAPYRDPDARATRVGGMDMVDPPVASTDFFFNTEEDGSGIDITSQLSVVVVFEANSAEVEVTNNGPRDGYLVKSDGSSGFMLRGRGVYAYETVKVSAESAESKALFGENSVGLDMPYQSDVSVATDAAQFVVAQGKTVYTQVKGAKFLANREARLLRSALTVDIGSRVRIEETVVGDAGVIPPGETEPVAAQEFFIQAVDLLIGERGITLCSWTTVPADAFTYWILERAGYTELGETTRLGYGALVQGWILGTSVLGTDTVMNV